MLPVGMAVDHADRPGPARLLAARRGNHVGRGGLSGVHVGGGDAPYHHGATMGLPDHAPHELRGIRAILQREVAARLVRQSPWASPIMHPMNSVGYDELR